jgi:alpha-ketoglutarate-dependent taurine dioxygenase
MTAVTETDVQQGGAVTVRPLQPTIGAEIGGVDLRRPLTSAARDQIKAAILQYKVVFFRDQDLDRDQHAVPTWTWS